MSQRIIRAALESRLSAWAAAQSPPIPISWQNIPFAPPNQARYLRAFLLPAETQDHAVTNDVTTYAGVFQVSVCVPDGSGAGAAELLVEALTVQFAAGTLIVRSGLSVLVSRTPSSAPAMQEPGLFVVPVSIRYRADVTT